MNIILSAKASHQLEKLLDYLEVEFSVITRRKFQKRLDRFIKVIKLAPQAFPASEVFVNCRKCVVTRQTSIYYRISDDVIEIIAVQANRQQI